VTADTSRAARRCRGSKVGTEQLDYGGANKLLNRALWYAEKGIPVFPLHSVPDGVCSCGNEACGSNAGKHPRTPHGFLDATADVAVIRRWWKRWPDANIGIPTGPASGLLVMDVDPRNGGKESLANFIREHGQLPHTIEQITGGGGSHYGFSFADGVRCGTLAPGIDYKGAGGYIVASPSLHLSGKTYRWSGSKWWDQLLNPSKAPKWLLGRIQESRNGARAESARRSEKWTTGERNNQLMSFAGTMRRRGMSRESIEAALIQENDGRCDPPLAETEVSNIAASVARYEPAESKRANAKALLDSTRFRLTDDGVFFVEGHNDTEQLRICGALEVAAVTRDSKSESWGRLLRWRDAESEQHEWAMPMALMSADGGEYRARLLDGGLFIAPGRKARELLTVYIQTAQPNDRALCVSQVGWHGPKFVLPGTTIGAGVGEAVIFQSSSDTEHLSNVSGTLQDWKNNIGIFCSDNSRLILAVSCALAGPTLHLIGAESGGVHLVGPSSKGKTTALTVGGSILGGGGRNGFVQSWRATANGLEAIAEQHNDLCLFLDELTQLDAREASEIPYLLGNGRGKQRMSRSIGARKALTWRLIFMSAGETTLCEHAQTAGKRLRGGGEVRLLNVDADGGAEMGIFENIHGATSPDAFARQLKSAALRCYGTPLRAWLEFLTKDRAAAKKTLTKFRTGFLRKHVPPGASGEVSRAAQRFALISAAGEVASAAGITGWTEGESTEAAAKCFQSWLANRGTTGAGDMEAAVRQFRLLLQANGIARFPLIRRDGSVDKDQVAREHAGFRHHNVEGECEYWIFSEVFRSDFCNGYSAQGVAKELCARGYLRRTKPHMTNKVRLPGLKNPVRVYCVSEKILEGDKC